jgi:hypothetical protein
MKPASPRNHAAGPPAAAGGRRAGDRTAALAMLAVVLAATIRAEAAPAPLGPWVEQGEVPLPENALSVQITREDEPLLSEPRSDAARRGSGSEGARLPIFAARRGLGCPGRWLLVGPQAWVCRNHVELTDLPPQARWERPTQRPDGLPFRYFFVGRDGSAGYRSLELADEAEPMQSLQPGFGVAIVAERGKAGNAYGLTHHGLWVPMRELMPVRAFLFHGEDVADGKLDVGWVLDDKTPLFARPGGGARARGAAYKMRFEPVHILEETGKGAAQYLRVGDGQWLKASAVRRPQLAAPPAEVGRAERWLDVELASQTLVAYEGERPVFATLVSTGKGRQGSATGTPKGVHRIWVKLRSSTMSNLDDENAASNYAIEDVPYVQFFHKGVALHGAFWHRSFGRVKSHGCVNLAPVDAQRIFDFTGPHLPVGWTAALPTEFEQGTVVRVRLPGPASRARCPTCSPAPPPLGAAGRLCYVSPMALDLPKDALLALAAVAWADGTLDKDEGDALLRVAREAGLAPDEIAELEEATRAPFPLAKLSTAQLSRGARVLVYALATWLARLDNVVTPEEKDSLVALGKTLELPDGIRTRASAAAFEVASLPAGDRPDRYDFQALKGRLAAKLGNVEAE